MVDLRVIVKRYCKEQGISQKTLAKRLGITDVGLNATLKKNNPRLETLNRIAAGLGVTVSELLNEQETEKKVDPVVEKIIERVPYFVCPHCGKEISLFVRTV